MFTGLIQSRGEIKQTEVTAGGCRLHVDISGLPLQRSGIGDSVAVNGVCLTIVALDQGVAVFDVSSETLDLTLIKHWVAGQQLNLELALTLDTALGGHLVSGHVDGLARLAEKKPTDDTVEMTFEVERSLGRFIAVKGSVCLDGISLTSNRVNDVSEFSRFSIMVVPHTLACTTLGELQIDDQVHLEIDLIARYLDRLRVPLSQH